MIFTLERVGQPVIEPVSLAEARRHLRIPVDVTEDDDDIVDLVKGGREFVEEYTGRALIDQEWRLTIDGARRWSGDTVRGIYRVNQNLFNGPWGYGPHGEIYLHRSPVIVLTSFDSVDQDGVTTSIMEEGSPPLSSYELREPDSKWPRLVPLSATSACPSYSFLKIQFRAGFAASLGSPDLPPDPALVPVRLRQAIKLWVEAMYDRDERMMTVLLDTAKKIIESECTDLRLA